MVLILEHWYPSILSQHTSKYPPEFTLEVMCVTSIFLDLTKGEDRVEELRKELFLRSEALLILERGAKIPGEKIRCAKKESGVKIM